MKNNIGEGERVVRIIASILLIAVGLTYQIWMVPVGIVVLLTGIVGWCPLYSLLNISTKNKSEQM